MRLSELPYIIYGPLTVITTLKLGNHFGEQNLPAAKLVTALGLILILISSGLFIIIFNAQPEKLVNAFASKQELTDLVVKGMPLLCLFTVFDGQTTILTGILSASGNQKKSALINFIGLYIVGLPLASVLAFKLATSQETLFDLWSGITLGVAITMSLKGISVLHWDWETISQKAGQLHSIVTHLERDVGMASAMLLGSRLPNSSEILSVEIPEGIQV